MINVSNGNYMLNANSTSSMSSLSGSCDAAPPFPCKHTHTTPPPAASGVASFVSHGVSSSAQSTLLFHIHCRSLRFPPFFFVPAVVLSFKHSDLEGILRLSRVHCTLSKSPTWRSLIWNRAGGSKSPLWWLYRFTSVANQLFYCNRGAALMRRGLFW